MTKLNVRLELLKLIDKQSSISVPNFTSGELDSFINTAYRILILNKYEQYLSGDNPKVLSQLLPLMATWQVNHLSVHTDAFENEERFTLDQLSGTPSPDSYLYIIGAMAQYMLNNSSTTPADPPEFEPCLGPIHISDIEKVLKTRTNNPWLPKPWYCINTNGISIFYPTDGDKFYREKAYIKVIKEPKFLTDTTGNHELEVLWWNELVLLLADIALNNIDASNAQEHSELVTKRLQ